MNNENTMEYANVLENNILQQVLDSLNELFCLFNENLEILWINKAAAKSLSTTKEELIGKHCYDLWGQQSTPCNDCPVLKALETGESQYVEKKTPDGRYWQLHGSVVYKEKGEVHYLVELGLDITEKKKIESDLKKTEGKLQNLLKSTSEFIWQVDKNGVYTFVSDNVEDIIGYSKSEIIGRTPFDFMDLAEAKRVGKIFSKIMENEEKIIRLQDTLIHKDGTPVIFETDATPLFDDYGNFCGYFGICRNITEIKKSKEALWKSESKVQSIFENAPDMLFTLNRTGRITALNKAPKGVEVKDALGDSIFNYVPNEFHHKLADVIEYVFTEKKETSFEIVANTDNGKLGYYSTSAAPILVGDMIEEAIFITRDVTERKQKDNIIKESEQRLKEAEKIARIGHVDWIVDEQKAFWSDVMFELYERDPRLGPPSYDDIMNLHDADDAERLKQLVTRAIEHGEPYETDLKAKLPSGKTAFYHAIGKPVSNETGRVTNIRGVVQDITERVKAEQRAKIYSSYLDRIMDESPVAMWISDASGTIIRTNHALREKLNLADGQIVGKYNVFKDLNLIENGVISEIEAVFEEQVPVRFCISWDPKKGGDQVEFDEASILWIDVSIFPIINDNGKLENVICQWVDVTELKEIEKALRESEQRYRAYINNAPNGVFVTDEQGNYIEVNEAATKITGYSEDELLSMGIFDTSAKDYKDHVSKDFEKLKQTGHATFDHKFLHRNGSIRWWRIDAVTLDDGRYMGFAHDITDKKKTVLDMVKAKKESENILNAAAGGIRVVDKDFQVQSLNETMSELANIESSNAKGMKCKDMFKSSRCDTENCSLVKVLRSGESFEFEEIRVNAKGEKIPCLCSTSPFTNERGEIIGIIEDFRDITPLKQVEEDVRKARDELQRLNQDLEKKVEERTEKIQQLLRQKDEFINQLGHDLKNPLGPFLQLLPILKHYIENEKGKQIVEVLDRNANYMKNLVKKTIDLAKLNSSKTNFIFEKKSLVEVVDEVIHVNIALFEDQNITIENNISSECQVFVDSLHIQEVFTNLFNNAVKYTDGPGHITVDASKKDEMVIVSVRDTGIGISNDQISYLFDEYYKADHSRHDFDSSGLGLPICKRIIERHNGKIWVESEGVGKGSTFYFTLPTINNQIN